MNFLDNYWSINLIQTELAIEFTEYFLKSFYLCKFSINKCYLLSYVCLCVFTFWHFTVSYVKKNNKPLHNFKHTLLCFHAIICHFVSQNRLRKILKLNPLRTESKITFELNCEMLKDSQPLDKEFAGKSLTLNSMMDICLQKWNNYKSFSYVALYNNNDHHVNGRQKSIYSFLKNV